jgi:hypothetical protein
MQTSSSANNYSSKSISSSDQHVIMHTKLDEEKRNHAGLAQENSFGSA